jgi:hypothetical protein
LQKIIHLHYIQPSLYRSQSKSSVKRGVSKKQHSLCKKEVDNLLTTLIEIEEGLLSGLAANAELRELLDELYDDME